MTKMTIKDYIYRSFIENSEKRDVCQSVVSGGELSPICGSVEVFIIKPPPKAVGSRERMEQIPPVSKSHCRAWVHLFSLLSKRQSCPVICPKGTV